VSAIVRIAQVLSAVLCTLSLGMALRQRGEREVASWLPSGWRIDANFVDSWWLDLEFDEWRFAVMNDENFDRAKFDRWWAENVA
jgi:hypothetical protein